MTKKQPTFKKEWQQNSGDLANQHAGGQEWLPGWPRSHLSIMTSLLFLSSLFYLLVQHWVASKFCEKCVGFICVGSVVLFLFLVNINKEVFLNIDIEVFVCQVLQKLPDKISIYPNMNSKTTRLNPGFWKSSEIHSYSRNWNTQGLGMTATGETCLGRFLLFLKKQIKIIKTGCGDVIFIIDWTHKMTFWPSIMIIILLIIRWLIKCLMKMIIMIKFIKSSWSSGDRR